MILAISLILILTYFGLLIYFMIGFHKLKAFNSEQDSDETKFTIIIPFRNEAEHLPSLLKSIFRLNYPRDKFEIILVDDASDDGSEEIISKAFQRSDISWRILPNKRVSASPKKDAISVAIDHSIYEWIVTTDADCVLPSRWLSLFNALIEKHHPVMICGPVLFSAENSSTLLHAYQLVEAIALQGISMGCFGHGKPILANGANLAYEKAIFRQVGGFVGNLDIASGDDIFLMDKIRKTYPERIVFLKNPKATVHTRTENSWGNVFQQRVRWASKTSKQQNSFSKIIGFILMLTNIFIIVAPAIALLIKPELFWFSIFIFLFKVYADIIFFTITNDFFKIKIEVRAIVVVALVYPFISSVIAVRSLFGGYRWKGRRFKR